MGLAQSLCCALTSNGELTCPCSLLPAFDDRLEDDDFDLIEENLGVKVKRVSSFFMPVFCMVSWDLDLG